MDLIAFLLPIATYNDAQFTSNWVISYCFINCTHLFAVIVYLAIFEDSGMLMRRTDTVRYDTVYLTCSKMLTDSQLSLAHGMNKNVKEKLTSASVELTQTRHSHSKQLLQGDRFQCFYREGQKASYAACKPLF